MREVPHEIEFEDWSIHLKRGGRLEVKNVKYCPYCGRETGVTLNANDVLTMETKGRVFEECYFCEFCEVAFTAREVARISKGGRLE